MLIWSLSDISDLRSRPEHSRFPEYIVGIFSVQSIARAVLLTAFPLTITIPTHYKITVLGRNEITCFGTIAKINIFKYQLKFSYYNNLKVGLIDFRGPFQP